MLLGGHLRASATSFADDLIVRTINMDRLAGELGAAQDRAGPVATSLVTIEVTADGAFLYQLKHDKCAACAPARAAICCTPISPPTIPS